MMKVKSLVISLLAALPGVASAQDVGPDVRVSYADLNLRTSEGVEVLDRRLARAVRLVCAEDRGTRELNRKIALRRCVAVQSAKVAIHRDQVLARAAVNDAMALSTP